MQNVVPHSPDCSSSVHSVLNFQPEVILTDITKIDISHKLTTTV